MVKWCAEAGLSHCTAHSFRKGLATYFAEKAVRLDDTHRQRVPDPRGVLSRRYPIGGSVIGWPAVDPNDVQNLSRNLRKESSRIAILIQKPHELRLAWVAFKALDGNLNLARGKALLNSRAPHLCANTRLGPIAHPVVFFGMAVSRSIDRHDLCSKTTECPRTRCSVPHPTVTQRSLTGINMMAARSRNQHLSAALVCRPPVPPGGVQRAPHSPEWRTGALLPPRGALSFQILVPFLFSLC
jgi:hypothetical protein